jgi:putative oxidoreductase
MNTWQKLLKSNAPQATILIRLVVGAVFLSEGIQKFIFANDLGVGRFAKIGIPAPGIVAPLVGIVEIICGTLMLIGLMTRLAAVPLIIDMLVAISTTKIPILLGHGFWRFGVSKLPSYGFWAMAHEARVDFAMLLGSIFLMIVGAGAWSIDRKMLSRWN